MKISQHKLTTIDNPFDVFDEYEKWLAYDQNVGHFTNELLGRVVYFSDDLSEVDQNLAVEQAIDEIVELDPFLKYKKVSREVTA